jgi:hypothetical protein
MDRALRTGELDLPQPGAGNTADRLARLAGFGRDDLSFARLAEPHVDATSIAADLGRCLQKPGLHAVWASGGPASTMRLHGGPGGRSLRGVKPFCSGAALCDAALISVHCDEDPDGALVEVDLRSARAQGAIRIDASQWHTHAFAATCTGTVEALDLQIDDGDVLGSARAYLHRPGFFHGALGPAAVWAGGIQALADEGESYVRDAHDLAALGHLRALRWSTTAWLGAAASEIDAAPDDLEVARDLAVTVRHLIERCAIDAIETVSSIVGPRGLAFDERLARRIAELQLYVRQFHGASELEALATRTARPS